MTTHNLPDPTDAKALREQAKTMRDIASRSSDKPSGGGITAARFWTIAAEASEQIAAKADQ